MARGHVHVCINPAYVIDVGGRDYHFEWHDYTGPTRLTKKGDPRPPFAERHPFWKALERWLEAGKHVDKDGRCLFEAPAAPTEPTKSSTPG